MPLKLEPGTRLVVATHNPGKAVELAEILEGRFDLVAAGAMGLPEPDETETTFAGNALLKARAAADAASTERRPRWVLGSVGPGTKLPTLGHVRFADLRDAYQRNVTGLLRGGVDAIVVDLPTALYLAAEEIENGKIVGQFSAPGGDEWGLLMQKESPLKPCLDQAVMTLINSGELQAITDQWIGADAAPVLE